MVALIIGSVLAGSLSGACAAFITRGLGGCEQGLRGPALTGAACAPLAAAALPECAWPAATLFGTLLLACAWLDLRARIVHAALAAPLAVAGVAVAAPGGVEALAIAASGAALGYLGFRAVEAAFRHLCGREGLGRGDAWMLGAVGAWVGPSGLGPLVALAAGGTLLGMLLRDGRLAAGVSVPLVPALAAAAWLIWITGGGAAAAWAPP